MTDKPAPVQNQVEPTIAIKLHLSEATSFASSVTIEEVPGERLRQAAEAYKNARRLDKTSHIPTKTPVK